MNEYFLFKLSMTKIGLIIGLALTAVWIVGTLIVNRRK